MKWLRLPVAGLFLLLVAAPALAASLESARRLYREQDFQRAKRELGELIVSSAATATKAEALHLLGTIAADEEDYPRALRLWAEVTRRYPDSAAAEQAAVKGRLVEALLECRGEEATVAGDASALGPTEASSLVEKLQLQAEEVVAEAPTPARASAEPPPLDGPVLVAGQGVPYDAVRETIAELVEFLTARDVDARNASEGIALVEESESAVDRLVEAVRQRGAVSLIFVTARFGGRERILVECFAPDAALLWKESVKGGMGPRERSMNPRLVRRMEGKLEARIAGPGLPSSGGSGESGD